MAFDGNMNKTRLALNHGCDIEDTVSTNSSSANALFNVACWDWSHPTIPIETLEFLLNIGYNIEQQSADGLTPLLSAATQHQPHVVKCLRLFTRRGANPHATDLKGRGVLHCALDASGFFDDLFRTLNGSYLEDSYTPDPQADAFIWFARVSFNTEDNSHKEDYDDEGADPGPLQDNIVNDMFHEADSAANEYSIDYIFCEGFDGALKKIRNPMQVLKERTMFKLLTLLQLGCDPNVVDHEGLSPSDTAREYGLWPQWRWALLNTGYIHHRQHGWVKSSFFK